MTTLHAPTGRPAAMLALLGTTLLALAATAIALPPASMTLLVVAVAATEYSPVVALLSIALLPAAYRLLRGRAAARRGTLVVLLLAAAVACWPLARFHGVARSAAMQLGDASPAARYSLLDAFRAPHLRSSVRERAIMYRAADGSPLGMQLYSGTSRGPRPTVVVIYGGAWRGGMPTQGKEMSRAIAASGYTVAAISYRHAPRDTHPAQRDDVRLALALLRDSSAAWDIDRSRLALLGRSAGGHLAELAAWSPGAVPVRAVIAIYAPFDLVQGYRDLPTPDPIGVRTVLRDFLGGTPDEQPARYRDASPSTWVRAGLPPTLLLYGGRDHVVKPTFNRDAAARLRAVRVPVAEVEVPWAEHGFDLARGGIGAQLALHVVLAFLARELR